MCSTKLISQVKTKTVIMVLARDEWGSWRFSLNVWYLIEVLMIRAAALAVLIIVMRSLVISLIEISLDLQYTSLVLVNIFGSAICEVEVWQAL